MNRVYLKFLALLLGIATTAVVTSAALLSLYQQGKFRLNDPLELYIPSFKNLKVYAGKDAIASNRYDQSTTTPQDAFT